MRTALRLTATIFALGGACAGVRAKAPAPPPPVPETAVRAVKGAAPKGWTVSTKGDTLLVRRDKRVSLYDPVNAPSFTTPQQLTAEWDYEIRLKFRARVAPEDYAKQQKENVQRGEKIEKMREGLRAAGIQHKFDDWLPNSDLQEEMVAAYRAEQKMLRPLPDLYSDTHSIDATDSRGLFQMFTNATEAEECDAVKKTVHKLFKAY